MITLEQAKKALGKTGKKMSDEEVTKLMATVDYLTGGWLELYEKSIFNGRTLKELLQK
jgi:hypothetical protein